MLAVGYISAACDTIAKHSLVRDSIDMGKLRTTALQIAGPASSYSDCYIAITYLMKGLCKAARLERMQKSVRPLTGSTNISGAQLWLITEQKNYRKTKIYFERNIGSKER